MTHTPASASFIACQLLRHRPCRGGRYWCHLRRCQGRAAVRLTSVFTPFLLFNEVFYHGSSSLSSVASLCISIHIYIYGTCSPNKLFEAVPGCVVVRHLLSFFARLHRSWSSSARSCTLGNFWCVYIYVYTYIYILQMHANAVCPIIVLYLASTYIPNLLVTSSATSTL